MNAQMIAVTKYMIKEAKQDLNNMIDHIDMYGSSEIQAVRDEIAELEATLPK